MMVPELDVLIVAAHPDDVELGAAGTAMRMKDEGLRVGILDLTTGEPTPFGTPELRVEETAAATEILALDWRHNLGLPNRSLEATLEARRALAGVMRQVRPRIVLCPYWVDAHPDHGAATQLVEAARFWCKLTKSDLPGLPCPPPRLLYFFSIHLRLAVQPSLVIDISPYWDRKRAAIECYKSQFLTGRPQGEPTVVDKVRDEAAYWGWQIGARYGEPLASREPLGFSSLRDLL